MGNIGYGGETLDRDGIYWSDRGNISQRWDLLERYREWRGKDVYVNKRNICELRGTIVNGERII